MLQGWKWLRLFEGKMADVECITLDEDEDLDHIPGAGRVANHPQMVLSYY